MDYLPEISAKTLTTVRRARMLPVPGEVFVQIGDHVGPSDIVAHADTSDSFHIIPVARRLGVPVKKVSRYLEVKRGDEVQAGQVIARRRGFARRIVCSPASGVVTRSARGRLLIEARSKSIDLAAYVPGKVTDMIPGIGVVIESQGALIECAWGVGDETYGVLRMMSDSPSGILREDSLDAACHGAVLVCGAGFEPGVLEQASELQVRGIISGSLNPEMLSEVRESAIPIVVTEGIGTTPMSTPMFRLLTANSGREACVSGKTQFRQDVVRPEVFIPLPADTIPSGSLAGPETPVAVGDRVRVLRAPYAGVVGTVVDLPKYARRIATGARVRGAEVKLESSEAPVFVPFANLEIVRS